MFQLQTSPGRTAVVDGRDFLFFSGYSYLGMSHVPEFVELVKEGIDKYGLLHPSSRISNTTLEIYDEFEERLSQLTSCEETVSFSSGYLSGRALIDTISKDNKNCFCAPDAHPAIMCNANSLSEEWKSQFIEKVNHSTQNDFVLLVDSVNPLKASVTNFSFLRGLYPDKNVTCVIDDSHGFGLAGTEVKGVQSLPVLNNVEFILSYSLSKAFHINGGGVSCSRGIAYALRKSPYYTGSTPIAPAFLHAFLNGQHLYHLQQKKLQDNISAFIAMIKDVPGIIYHPELPVFILPPHIKAETFARHNIIISSFAYATTGGQVINRIVLNALHTGDDLKNAATILSMYAPDIN
jgi:7-keto-8-aminopelargonate synthetase-like enzyme